MDQCIFYLDPRYSLTKNQTGTGFALCYRPFLCKNITLVRYTVHCCDSTVGRDAVTAAIYRASETHTAASALLNFTLVMDAVLLLSINTDNLGALL